MKSLKTYEGLYNNTIWLFRKGIGEKKNAIKIRRFIEVTWTLGKIPKCD
jgi:hypothetical protein